MSEKSPKFNAIVEYEDPYVQPIILEAIKSIAPNARIVPPDAPGSSPEAKLLQIRAYESLDFEKCLQNPQSLCNAYIIRKALIRKHYLSHTTLAWTTKNPTSALKKHFKPAEAFELDYAEFLDDALVEAFDLRASFVRNEDKPSDEREWWILKPGMSDRGQGIRLFSTEAELQEIFDGWEGDESDEAEDEDDTNNDGSQSLPPANGNNEDSRQASATDNFVTSHLRHFIAQPYIHPPLLIPESPFRNRKFHIRTYVVATGALQVYVYNHMLALFASEPYVPPWETADPADDADVLQRMQNVHLTNTCVQTASLSQNTEENVFLLASLPLTPGQHSAIQAQIRETTAELFRAAVGQPTNFQPLPNAFEIFGMDFLVEKRSLLEMGDVGREEVKEVSVKLLEVNAFPDFAQTGPKLRDLVIKGLFEEVMRCVVCPFFSNPAFGEDGEEVLKDNRTHADSDPVCSNEQRMTKVLDLAIGRW